MVYSRGRVFLGSVDLCEFLLIASEVISFFRLTEVELNNHGQRKRYTHSTKPAIVLKSLITGSNVAAAACAEGLDESKVGHFVKNILEGSVAKSNSGEFKARHI